MSQLLALEGSGSAMERVDPRTKILVAILAVLALIVADSTVIKSAVVVALVLVWLGARLGLRLLAVTIGSLTFFFLTTMVLRAVIRGGSAADAITYGPVRWSPDGAVDGLSMCLQILGVMLALTVLVRATAPVPLAEGMELLLSPLRRFGVPAHEAVMMFSIALRFLPIMFREITRMQTAQLARGGGVHRGGLRARIGTVLPLLIPVVIVALVRARDLAEAMESRGYRGAIDRTAVREYQFRRSDVLAVAVAGFLLLISIAARLS